MIIEWFWFPSFDRFRLRVEIWPFISYLVSWVCCLIVLAYSYIQNTEFIVDCCLWSSQISTRRRESLKGLHQPKWIHRAVIWSWRFYVNEFWKVMHLACIRGYIIFGFRNSFISLLTTNLHYSHIWQYPWWDSNAILVMTQKDDQCRF